MDMIETATSRLSIAFSARSGQGSYGFYTWLLLLIELSLSLTLTVVAFEIWEKEDFAIPEVTISILEYGIFLLLYAAQLFRARFKPRTLLVAQGALTIISLAVSLACARDNSVDVAPALGCYFITVGLCIALFLAGIRQFILSRNPVTTGPGQAEEITGLFLARRRGRYPFREKNDTPSLHRADGPRPSSSDNRLAAGGDVLASSTGVSQGNSKSNGAGITYAERRKVARPKGSSWPSGRPRAPNSHPHFFRCTCCVDAVSKPRTPRNFDDTGFVSKLLGLEKRSASANWCANRDGFLFPYMPSLNDEDSVADGTRNMHKLCDACKDVCSRSKILQFSGSWNPASWYRLQPREFESFEHHGSLKELQNCPCHLCNLIWSSLSREQQQYIESLPEELTVETTIDSSQVRGSYRLGAKAVPSVIEAFHQTYTTLRRKLQNHIDDLYSEHTTRADSTLPMRNYVPEAKAIRLVIEGFRRQEESLGFTFRKPADFDLAEEHPLAVARYAQIVPHFFGSERPQGWMAAIRGSEDLRYIGAGEYVPPIYVMPARAVPLQSRGGISGTSRVWMREPEDDSTSFRPNRPICLPLSSSTGSNQTVSCIRNWLHDTRGMVKLEDQFLPNRLIDVDPSPLEISQEARQPSEHMCRLVLRTELPAQSDSRIEYVALSHCWGTVRFPSTMDPDVPVPTRPIPSDQAPKEHDPNNPVTKGRHYEEHIDIPVSLFRCGIPCSKLSRTFRDAVDLTKRLGLKYVWIDSLCILQNSRDDMNRELPLMGEIYKNAVFTLANVAAWGSHEGLYRPRMGGGNLNLIPPQASATFPTPTSRCPCLLTVKTGKRKSGKAPTAFYAIPSHWNVRRHLDAEIEMSKWNSRAWTLQERELSQRIVYFSQNQVYCEVKHLDDPVHLRSMTFQNDLRRYFETSFVQQTTTDHLPLSRSKWWDYVTMYTQREMERKRDKLPAISALAKHLSAMSPNSIYVAGLWVEWLATDLLWYVDMDRKAERPQANPECRDDYRMAPSWSWASVDGVIFNDSVGMSAETSLEVLEVVAPGEPRTVYYSKYYPPTNRDGPPLGLLPAGSYLRVKGKIQRAKYEPMPPARKYRYYVATGEVGLAAKEFFMNPPYKSLYNGKSLDTFGVEERWLTQYRPLSRDPSAGPEAYQLLNEESKEVGWLLPDAAPNLQDSREIYCLQIKIEPTDWADKEDPTKVWAIRGLALVPTNPVSIGAGGYPTRYRRVGYFELEQQGNGIRWPDIWTGRLSRHGAARPVRNPPTFDPYMFFENAESMEVDIV